MGMKPFALLMALIIIVPNASAIASVYIETVGEDGGHPTPEASYAMDYDGVYLFMKTIGTNATAACDAGNPLIYFRIENSANTANYTPWVSITTINGMEGVCQAYATSPETYSQYNFYPEQIAHITAGGTYKIMSNFSLNTATLPTDISTMAEESNYGIPEFNFTAGGKDVFISILPNAFSAFTNNAICSQYPPLEAYAYGRFESASSGLNVTPWHNMTLNNAMGICESGVQYWEDFGGIGSASLPAGEYKYFLNFTLLSDYNTFGVLFNMSAGSYKTWEMTMIVPEGLPVNGIKVWEASIVVPEEDNYVPEYNAFDIGYAAIDLVAGSLVGVAGVSFDLGTIIGVVVVLVLVGGVVLLAIAAIVAMFKGGRRGGR